MKTKPELSIVILNYNTNNLLKNCLKSLENSRGDVSFEIVVSDNGSSDGSSDMVKREFPWVKLVENIKNKGFAAGNNSARHLVNGKFVLFLNSDTEVRSGTLKDVLDYIKENSQVGAITCKIVLPNGSLDKDTRRSFPTPWVSFTHFSGLDRLFPNVRLLSKYWYGYIPENETHEVDVIQGAFLMVRKKVLDSADWFDEDYFLDGEDIDLCWKIKEKGFKIVYYPKVSIKHIKGATKGKKSTFGIVTKEEKLSYIMAGVESMKIFYKKRLWSRYPSVLNLLVISGINLIKAIRYLKALIT